MKISNTQTLACAAITVCFISAGCVQAPTSQCRNSVGLLSGYLNPPRVVSKQYTNSSGDVLSYYFEENIEIIDPQNQQSAPLVVFVHGGAWQNNGYRSKGFYERDEKFDKFFKENVNTASANYRLYQPPFVNPHPTQRNDIIDFILHIQSTYNPSKMCLVGLSSGSHTAATIAVIPNVEEALNIHCLIGVSGVYDFSPLDLRETDPVAASTGISITAFGAITDFYDNALDSTVDPVATIVANGGNYDLPTLIIHDTKDTLITYPQALAFAEYVPDLPGIDELVAVTGEFFFFGHVTNIFNYTAGRIDCNSVYAEKATDFLEEYLVN